MKAIAVTPQKRKVAIINHDEPKVLSPTDVKLRMLEAASVARTRRFALLNTAPRRRLGTASDRS